MSWNQFCPISTLYLSISIYIYHISIYINNIHRFSSLIILLLSITILTGCSLVDNINKNNNIGIGKTNNSKNMEDVRKPAVAGQFYSADTEELKEQIEGFLKRATSPQVEGKVKAIMTPHAGYDFSGPVAAEAYKQIEDEKMATVVIIGNSHSSFFEGVAVDDSSAWETPLGEVKVDTQFANKLMANTESIVFNGAPHRQEHSLEVQVPFLQTVLDGDFKIVPILFGNVKDESECRVLADALAASLGKNDLVAVSSDMSHFPPYEDANRIDKRTLEIIESTDIEELEEHISSSMSEGIPQEDTLLCGEDAVRTVMHLAHIKQWDTIKTLKYANSGDTDLGDKESVVGYGAVAFADSTAKQEQKQEQEEAPIETSSGELEGLTRPLTPKQKEVLLNVAKQTVETYVQEGAKPEFNITDERLREPEGAFVTLKKNGELRGCIGQIVQTEAPLWKVIQDVAVSAAVDDDRFEPVTSEELSELTYEVSVLSIPSQVDNWRQVQPGKHGVIIRQGQRSGVFLPQVAEETGWNREEFLSQLCFQKLGSTPECYKDPNAELFIFTAQAFSEDT